MPLPGFLGERVGPLPAIAWAGIAGAGYVGYRWYKHFQSGGTADTGTTSAPVDTSQSGIDPTTGLPYANPGYSNATGGFINAGQSGSGNTTPTIGAPTTNSDWGTRAANYLIGLGDNPTDVQTALSSYLYGTGVALNTVQSAMLQEALRFLGSPPEGVIAPPTTTPSPTPGPLPKPSTKPVTKPSPTVNPAIAAAATSFHKAQDLANLFGGPVHGPNGVVITPGERNPSSWDAFDAALHDSTAAQQLANYLHKPITGPGGRVFNPVTVG